MEGKSDFPMKFGNLGTNLMKFIEITSTLLTPEDRAVNFCIRRQIYTFSRE